MFTRIPSGDELARFKRYASWMRVLGPSKAVMISDDVLQQLSLATSGGPVCPQLKRLVWPPSYGCGHIQQFLSPRLVSVIFRKRRWHHLIPSDSTLASIIPFLPTTHLEELRLEFIPPPVAPIHSVLSEVVQRLNTCFKRISTRSPLTDPAWEHLASLPRLKSLRVSNTPTAEISELIPCQFTFPALERVKIVAGDRYQRWGLIFSLLESSPLKHVSVSGHRIQGGDVPSDVTFAMLRAKLQRSVSYLNFTRLDPANFTFLSRLGPFGSLKTLKCNTWCQGPGQCVSPLTDPDIEQLASELPHLAILCLGHECRWSPHNTTIKSMISLSTQCLSLEVLHLPCDLTRTSEDIKTGSRVPDPRQEIRSPCALRVLAFEWVTMPRPEDTEASGVVASVLHHLFPLLPPIGE